MAHIVVRFFERAFAGIAVVGSVGVRPADFGITAADCLDIADAAARGV